MDNKTNLPENLTLEEIGALNSNSDIFSYDAINETLNNELKPEIRAEDLKYKGLIFPREDHSASPKLNRHYLNNNPLNVISKNALAFTLFGKIHNSSLMKKQL